MTAVSMEAPTLALPCTTTTVLFPSQDLITTAPAENTPVPFQGF